MIIMSYFITNDFLFWVAAAVAVGFGVVYCHEPGNVFSFVAERLRKTGTRIDIWFAVRGRRTEFFAWLPRPVLCPPCASGWAAIALTTAAGQNFVTVVLTALAAIGVGSLIVKKW